jgi:hypothetical protein
MTLTNTTHQTLSGTLERVFVIIAFVYNLIITTYLWIRIALQQPIWLFPALYFLELVLLSGIVLLFVFQSWPLRMHIIAGSAGVVTSFSVMGVFSVGLFYAPLALLLLLGALASWRASHKPIIMLLGAYILFALVQTFGMLILASL